MLRALVVGGVERDGLRGDVDLIVREHVAGGLNVVAPCVEVDIAVEAGDVAALPQTRKPKRHECGLGFKEEVAQ